MPTIDASLTARNRLLYIVAPVFLMGVLADQTSKSWASNRAVEPCILVPGYLAAYSVPNAGMLLGLGGDQAHTNSVFTFLGIACAGLLARIAFAERGRWQCANCLACALLFAGILGNTVDRIALGHVRDFLVTWAIPTVAFNVADLLVAIGCVSSLMVRYWGDRRSRPDRGSAALAAA